MIIVSVKRGDVFGGFRAHFLFWAKHRQMKKLVDERIREIAAQVAGESNVELVHAQIAGAGKSLTVRVFIDKEGGVMHEDCSLVSRRLEKELDAEDFIPGKYILEVSSPGLERELYNLKDFEKFTGSLAKVKTSVAFDGQKNFRGRIVGIESDEIVFEDKTRGTIRFPYSAVAKANLEIDLEEELKRNEKRKVESGK
jgi:ribosome maturation factor RimP